MEALIKAFIAGGAREKPGVGDRIVKELESGGEEIDSSMVTELVNDVGASLKSSNFKVCLASIRILAALLNGTGEAFDRHVDVVLPGLIERLGDSKESVRDEALELLISIMADAWTPQRVFDHLKSGLKHRNPRLRESTLKCFEQTINKFGAHSLNVSKLIPGMVQLLGDPDANVRSAASDALVEAYRHIGSRVKNTIRNLKNAPKSKMPALYERLNAIKHSGTMLVNVDGDDDDGDDDTGPVRGQPRPRRTVDINGNAAHGDDDDDDTHSVTSTVSDISHGRLGRRSKRPSSHDVLSAQGSSRTSPTKRESFSVPGGSRVVSHHDPSANKEGGMTRDEFDSQLRATEPEELASDKALSDFFATCKKILEDKKLDWEKRVVYLTRLRALTVGGAYLKHGPPSGPISGSDLKRAYMDGLKLIGDGMATSILDLRSGVVKEVTLTIAVIVEQIGRYSASVVEQYVPDLLKQLKVSIKIIQDTVKHCLDYILHYVQHKKVFERLIEIQKSRSVTQRRVLASAISTILTEWDAGVLHKLEGELASSIHAGIADSDSIVRATARRSYWHLHATAQESAVKLYRVLSPTQQKHVDAEKEKMERGEALGAPSSSHESGTTSSVRSSISGRARRTKTQGQAQQRSHSVHGIPKTTPRERSKTPTLGSARRSVVPQSSTSGSGSSMKVHSDSARGGKKREIGRARRSVVENSHHNSVAPSSSAYRSSSVKARTSTSTPSQMRAKRGVRKETASPSQLPRRSATLRSTTDLGGSLSRQQSQSMHNIASSTSPRTAAGRRTPQKSQSRPVSLHNSRSATPTASPRHSVSRTPAQHGRPRSNTTAGTPTPTKTATTRSPRHSTHLSQRPNSSPGSSSVRRSRQRGADGSASPSPSKRMGRASHNASPAPNRTPESLTSFGEAFAEIVELCDDKTWADRLAGIQQLKKLIRSTKTPSQRDLKRVCAFFAHHINEQRTKIFLSLLDVLCELIVIHQADLPRSWLRDVIPSLLLRFGSGVMNPQLTLKVNHTLDLISSTFPQELLLSNVFKLLLDPTQQVNLKACVACMEFMMKVLPSTSAATINSLHAISPSEHRGAISKIINMTTEPKSGDLRRLSTQVVVHLFEANPQLFHRVMAALPLADTDLARSTLSAHIPLWEDIVQRSVAMGDGEISTPTSSHGMVDSSQSASLYSASTNSVAHNANGHGTTSASDLDATKQRLQSSSSSSLPAAHRPLDLRSEGSTTSNGSNGSSSTSGNKQQQPQQQRPQSAREVLDQRFETHKRMSQAALGTPSTASGDGRPGLRGSYRRAGSTPHISNIPRSPSMRAGLGDRGSATSASSLVPTHTSQRSASASHIDVPVSSMGVSSDSGSHHQRGSGTPRRLTYEERVAERKRAHQQRKRQEESGNREHSDAKDVPPATQDRRTASSSSSSDSSLTTPVAPRSRSQSQRSISGVDERPLSSSSPPHSPSQSNHATAPLSSLASLPSRRSSQSAQHVSRAIDTLRSSQAEADQPALSTLTWLKRAFKEIGSNPHAGEWQHHYPALLNVLLELLADPAVEVREGALTVMREMLLQEIDVVVKAIPTILPRVLESHEGGSRDLNCVADEVLDLVCEHAATGVALDLIAPFLQDTDSVQQAVLIPTLNLLARVLGKGDADVVEEKVDAFMPGLLQASKHKAGAVRKSVIMSLVKFYITLGEDRAVPHLSDLSPHQRNLLGMYIQREQKKMKEVAIV